MSRCSREGGWSGLGIYTRLQPYVLASTSTLRFHIYTTPGTAYTTEQVLARGWLVLHVVLPSYLPFRCVREGGWFISVTYAVSG